MRCSEARALLWPPEALRLAESEVEEARTHVASCSACAAYLRQDRVLLDAYRRLAQKGAPSEVRERVFDALAVARAQEARSSGESSSGTGGVGRRMRWVLAGGGLLAAASVATVLALSHGGPAERPVPPGSAFVEDYLRRAVGEDHITTSDPMEVRAFLARELGIHITPLTWSGLVLEGAVICLLEGRRGAMVVYRKDGGVRVSHYIVPREGAVARPPELTHQDGAAPSDMPVVTWGSPELEQALVGELPAHELLRLAGAAES